MVVCEAHGEPTRLSCVDCGKPICPKCAVRTEVGLKCEADARPADLPKAALDLMKPSRSRLVVGLAGLAVVVVAIVVLVMASGSDEPTPTAEQPPVGTWESAPAPAAIRGTATATLLSDGRLLVAGGGVGQVPVPNVEIFDPAGGQWQPTGSLAVARRGHSAVRLSDGRVLVSGGIAEGMLLASAEIYDPAARTWSSAGRMAIERLGHSLTLLSDGRVLAAGGSSQGGPDGTGRVEVSAEIFDPRSGSWRSTAQPMGSPRFEHTATGLDDGRVLLVGGRTEVIGGSTLVTTELYDPAIDSFVRSTDLNEARANHAATKLADGGVLITGGVGGPEGDRSLATVEVFAAGQARWDQVTPMPVARAGHTATLLSDGRVLVAAGESVSRGARRSLDGSEVLDLQAREWRLAGTMPCARSEQAAALLNDGTVLVVAGDTSFPGQAPTAASCADRYRP